MQLTRIFSVHSFQSCFNFEKTHGETSPCACIRIKYCESFPFVTFSGRVICHCAINMILQYAIHTIQYTAKNVNAYEIF